MPGGATINSLDVRQVVGGQRRIFFDLFMGLHDGLVRVGTDDDIAEASGGRPQPRRAVRRELEWRGSVAGVGATLADRRADYHDAVEELFDALDLLTGTQYPVVLTGPYLGIPDGETRTINARYAGHEMADPDPDWARRVMIIRLFSLDSPPIWVPGP